MSEEEEETTEEGEEGGKKKSKKMLFIILGVVLLLAAGIPAALMLGGGEDEADGHGEEEHEEEVHYETYELEPFIVNLSKTSSFLKVRLLVEFDPNLVNGGEDAHGGGGAYGGGGSGGGEAAPSGPPGVLGEKDPMIRDAIIMILSSKKAEDVLTVDGKEELKVELLDAINDATGLDDPPIVNVYFLEFIVQ
jgi:flagellar FliL protein